jgi:hypothetical protein
MGEVEPIHHSILAQQVGKLGNIRRNPSRFISAEQLGRCWLPCILVIDVRERLPSAVLDYEASEVIFNGPWWWEATTLRHTLTLPEIMRGQRNERLGEPAALIALWALHLRLNEVVRIASGCVLRSAQRWGK